MQQPNDRIHHTTQRQLYASKVLIDKGTNNVYDKRNVIFVMQVGGERYVNQVLEIEQIRAIKSLIIFNYSFMIHHLIIYCCTVCEKTMRQVNGPLLFFPLGFNEDSADPICLVTICHGDPESYLL
jgi:hypothetical protein